MTDGKIENTVWADVVSGVAMSGTGTAINSGTSTVYAGDRRPKIDELLGMLKEGREVIVESGTTDDDRADLRHEIAAIITELEKPEPRKKAVRGRWDVVLDTAGKVASTVDIGKITQLVTSIFGG